MDNYIGKRVYEGIAIGKIFYINNNNQLIQNTFSGEQNEINRFKEAQKKALNYYREIYNYFNDNNIDGEKDIILSFSAIIEDLDFVEKVEKLINIEKVSAELAIKKAMDSIKEQFYNLDNDYLKERTKDFDEVGNKLIQILQNNIRKNDIIEPSIIVSETMEVSDLMIIDKNKIKGLVLENTSPNAHIAILAKSLSIPCIVSLNKKVSFNENELVILDANNGILIVSPSKEVINEYTNKLNEIYENKNKLQKYKNVDIKTIDNKRIKVYANITSSNEVIDVIQNNADGIGLFRSEFIYLNSSSFPSENEQFLSYKKVLEAIYPKEAIIRTIDIGADKQISYFKIPKEKNPTLGFRGVRIYKEFYNAFYTQIRALLRASIYGNLKIMIPMVISIEEVLFFKQTIEKVKEDMQKENIKYSANFKVGIMVETPAAALICDELAPHIDFISIGTNDLTQYTLAIDRENNKVLHIYNGKHKSILRLIKYIADVAKKYEIEIGICGELAREKNLLSYFIRCGIDELSVSPSYILQLKKNITEINTSEDIIEDYI